MRRNLQEQIVRIKKLSLINETGLWDLLADKTDNQQKQAAQVKPEIQEFFTNLQDAAKTGLSQQQAGQMNFQKDIETMQIALELLGYPLPHYGVDGKFGPETAAAVRKFKTDNSILNETAEDLRNTLNDLGYEEKGNEISSGGNITDDLSSIVSKILTDFKKISPNVKVIVTSGNDQFHKNLGYKSKHATGNAVDVVLRPYSSSSGAQFKSVLDKYKSNNFTYIDEYVNPSGSATGGHFHLQTGSPAVQGDTVATSQNMVVATPDTINKMIELLKAKNIQPSDIEPYTRMSNADNIQFTGTKDNDFYKAILKNIGAPITSENLKFLYAWRQAEGHGGKFNPFNTTWKKPGSVAIDKDGVQSYKDINDGLSATVKTILEPRFKCIADGLRQNIGADKIAACPCIEEWGTGALLGQVVAGYNSGHKPKLLSIMA
jgi:peptidoglycan hydrolase-like protein with peptidoglycan-binding domain